MKDTFSGCLEWPLYTDLTVINRAGKKEPPRQNYGRRLRLSQENKHILDVLGNVCLVMGHKRPHEVRKT